VGVPIASSARMILLRTPKYLVPNYMELHRNLSASGGQITGTWTVTGATGGWSGNGTFTMSPMLGA
jgi:hypothetical protein